MVKRILSFFSYVLFFTVAVMYFTPKVSIYYLLEEQIKPYNIIVSSEDHVDSGFTLNLKNANISVKSIESATIDEIDMKLFVLYNVVNLKGITLSSTAKYFAPLNIENANIVYSIFNPLNVKAHSVGEFGELDATFNIAERTLHIDLLPSKEMLKDYKSTLKNLTKDENGEFTYDKTF